MEDPPIRCNHVGSGFGIQTNGQKKKYETPFGEDQAESDSGCCQVTLNPGPQTRLDLTDDSLIMARAAGQFCGGFETCPWKLSLGAISSASYPQ